MEALTMHWYPDFIIQPIYKMRSLKIIVKENAKLDGAGAQIQDAIKRKVNEATEFIANSGNLWASGKKVSDIKTTNVDKNTKRIMNAIPIYACALPLPNELLDSQSHRWELETGIVGTLAGGLVDAASVKGVGINKILGEASASFGLRKPLVDPGMFQNYNGSTPRNFDFGFDLIPNNTFEAENIMNIILNLKKFSLPRSMIGGVSLMAPFLFEIEIGNDNMKKLINMNDVVLTEIRINYGADGNMQMFSNGMPKFIQLNLSFSERSLVTSEFYD